MTEGSEETQWQRRTRRRREKVARERVTGIVELMLGELVELDDEELSDVRAYLDGCTGTNSWWATYWLRDGLRRVVAAEQTERARLAAIEDPAPAAEARHAE